MRMPTYPFLMSSKDQVKESLQSIHTFPSIPPLLFSVIHLYCRSIDDFALVDQFHYIFGPIGKKAD